MKIKKLIKKYNLFSGTQVIIMPHNSVVVGVDYERTYGDSHICMYVIEEEKMIMYTRKELLYLLKQVNIYLILLNI